MSDARTGLQLQSTVKKQGRLELALARVPVPEPGPEEVLVRVEAAPINPSDLGVLFAAADMTKAEYTERDGSPVVAAPIPLEAMPGLAARVDAPVPGGNEGAGVVVEAGDSEAAQALLGRTVAILGGAMYGQYRCFPAKLCLALPEGTTAAEGASCFVNPLTSLGMVETMRSEGHTALVHTAAASNLGQMLVRLCLADDVGLVNVVRRPEQAELLRGLGAKHVCDSSLGSFDDDLVDAIAETGATLGFDATGGGKLASRILTAMEVAASRGAQEYSRYGSTVHKQVYLYGSLDRGPTVLERNYGMAWGIGGWLLPPFLQKIGFEAAQTLRERVAAEIKTTFASRYTRTVSLADMLRREVVSLYGRQATGEKVLVDPSRDVATLDG